MMFNYNMGNGTHKGGGQLGHQMKLIIAFMSFNNSISGAKMSVRGLTYS